MGHGGQPVGVIDPQLNDIVDREHLTSAQLLRRHAQDLIEAAERMLAQAEAELETAYAMVSGATAPFNPQPGRS